MSRRNLFPMPVEPILDHPAFIAMPAAAAGIVFRLAGFHWQTECGGLPVADHELRAVGRVHVATWKVWKTRILQVFADVRPELDAYHAERLRKGTTLSFAGKNAAAQTNARRRAKAIEDAARPQPSGPTWPHPDPDRARASAARQLVASRPRDRSLMT